MNHLIVILEKQNLATLVSWKRLARPLTISGVGRNAQRAEWKEFVAGKSSFFDRKLAETAELPRGDEYKRAMKAWRTREGVRPRTGRGKGKGSGRSAR